MSNRRPRFSQSVVCAMVVASWLIVFKSPLFAIPAFARKYDTKCSSCHTIFPRLNKTGYLSKRLGYSMPPDMEEDKPVPKIHSADKNIRWNLGDTLALVFQTSATYDKTGAPEEPSTTNNSLNLDNALLFLGGTIPESNFSYFGEYKLYEDGETALEKVLVQYTHGNVRQSFFVKGGKMQLQETSGFRGSDPLGLFREGPLMFTAVDPNLFTMDQAPTTIAAGFTWASMYYKQVLGLTMKVTNGLNADGSEIVQDSEKHSKDVWLQADYLFGPDGGVSFMGYFGRKYQVQNEGLENEFEYYPRIRRWGVFGNYLFFDKLDTITGYMHGRDDWKWESNDTILNYKNDSWYGEVDYYLQTGFAATARYDWMREKFDLQDGFLRTRAWTLGLQKTLTKQGNLCARLSYMDQKITDPADQIQTEKHLAADIRLGW